MNRPNDAIFSPAGNDANIKTPHEVVERMTGMYKSEMPAIRPVSSPLPATPQPFKSLRRGR